MPVTTELRENGRVLYLVYEDPWTIADVAVIDRQFIDILHQATHPIHALLNVQQIHEFPSGIFTARIEMILTHPMSGHLAIIGTSNLVRVFGQTMMRLRGFSRARFFNHEEDGWHYLQQIVAEEQSQTNRKAIS